MITQPSSHVPDPVVALCGSSSLLLEWTVIPGHLDFLGCPLTMRKASEKQVISAGKKIAGLICQASVASVVVFFWYQKK